MDIKKDLQIDPSKLDEEWIKQPYLFQACAEKVVDHEDARDRQKRNLEIILAETEKGVRQCAEENSEKLTEAKVKALVVTNAKVVEAEMNLLDLTKAAKIAGVAIKTLEHKKEALKNLTKLYEQGYSKLLCDGGLRPKTSFQNYCAVAD